MLTILVNRSNIKDHIQHSTRNDRRKCVFVNNLALRLPNFSIGYSRLTLIVTTSIFEVSAKNFIINFIRVNDYLRKKISLTNSFIFLFENFELSISLLFS